MSNPIAKDFYTNSPITSSPNSSIPIPTGATATKTSTTSNGALSNKSGTGSNSTGAANGSVGNGTGGAMGAGSPLGSAMPVHRFDPDASPREKAAQAVSKDSAKLNAIAGSGPATMAKEVKPEKPGSSSIQPTISITDVSKTTEAEEKRTKSSDPPSLNPPAGDAPAIPSSSSSEGGDKKDEPTEPKHPGGYPFDKAAPVPDWYKIGWNGQGIRADLVKSALAQAGKGEKVTISETDIKERELLEEWLSDVYYGQWYYNAGIIIFAVLASHFITVFGGGWGWLLVILAFCSTYYQISMKRVRMRARDDITRELSKATLIKDSETADWVNQFMSRFWIIYEPVLSGTIVQSVDQVLSVSTPAFLDSLKMSTFTLGSKAPRIDSVWTDTSTDEDIVVMDWALSFVPNDVQDLTTRQIKNKSNPKVALTVRIGKGVAGVSKDIVVEDITFKGKMRIRLKLMTTFPHVQAVDLQFLDEPFFDFVLKPIGFDLSIIPGLQSFIHSQVHANLGPMMYKPHFFTIDLAQMLSGAPTDTAIGILQVNVYSASGIRGTKTGGGTPDPYVSFSLNQRGELAKTKVKKSTINPHWNEHIFLLVNNLSEMLTLSVMDWNEHRKDNELGNANFDLKTLEASPEQEGITAPVMNKTKANGELRYDVNFFPCLKPNKLPDGTEEPIPDTKTGVVRIVIHQAKDLDAKHSVVGQLNPYAALANKGELIYKTQVLKRTNNPVWEMPHEFAVFDKKTAIITVKVMDERTGHDPCVGFVNVRLQDILDANAKQQDWFPLSGCRSGRLRMSAQWKPVIIPGTINGAGEYSPPIGVVRLWFKKGVDLKNVEALTGGKSDPYVRVLQSGIVRARTHIINNNLNPEWDEIVYVCVHSAKDRFVVECMDYQHNTKDRSLGVTELAVDNLIMAGPDKNAKPYASKGKQVYNKADLKSDNYKSVKGYLAFEAEFFPAIRMKNSTFETVENPLSKVEQAQVEEDGTTDDGASTIDTASESGDRESFFDDEDRELELQLEKERENLAKGIPSSTAKTNGDAAVPRSRKQSTTSNSKTATDGSRRSIDITRSGRPSFDSVRAGSVRGDGVDISQEQLLGTQSGILVFSLMRGSLWKKGARLEVLFDDGFWASYSTEPARSHKPVWDEVGEAFIRELDYSRILFKLNMAEKETREDVYAQADVDLKTFIERCLDKPTDFELVDVNGEHRSVVTIQCKYIPVDIEILARESVNNMGVLRVDLLEARDIPAADRNGKSDPNVRFFFGEGDDNCVFRSEVKKKTLNPTWSNATFETQVLSRVKGDFRLEVHDWNRIDSSKKLGDGRINLADLEAFQGTEQIVNLTNPETGGPGGTVKLRILFRPKFISQARTATSTFVGTAGRVATGLGGGVYGVGKVAGKGVGGVGKGVGGLLGISRRPAGHAHTESFDENEEREAIQASPIPPVPPLPDSIPNGNGALAPSAIGASEKPALKLRSASNASSAIGAGMGAPGVLTIKIFEAKGLPDPDAKPYVKVKNGGKEIGETSSVKHSTSPTFDKTLEIKTSRSPCELTFYVLNKKTFGRDKEIGEVLVNLWQHIQPLASPSITHAELLETLSLGGTRLEQEKLHLELRWVPTEAFDAPPSPRSQKTRTSRISFSRHARDQS